MAVSDLRALLDAVNVEMSRYIDEYEMDDGESVYHRPTRIQHVLIADAMQGLVSDEKFVAAYNAWQDEVRIR